MFRRQYPIVLFTGVVAAGAVLVGVVAPAESSPQAPNDKLVAYVAKIQRLEAEMQALKDELHVCRQQKPTAAIAPATLPRRGPTALQASDPCSPPFTISSEGIRQPKAECLETIRPCEPPYHYVDKVKTYKPECF